MRTDWIRAMTGARWIALFGLILLAWVALFFMAAPPDLRIAGRVYGSAALRDLCRVTPDLAGFVRLLLMWALMSGAMMAPTALPALATYDTLPQRHSHGFSRLAAGYLSVWIGFSAVAALAQMALVAADLVSPFGDSRSVLLSAGLLALAGAYQFSPLKQACLSACRSPLIQFFQHWQAGPFWMGWRMGLTCLGCCWALMLLAFVGGVTNLAFMGVAMALMFIEKLPDLGRYVTRPLGGALIAAALFVLWRGF